MELLQDLQALLNKNNLLHGFADVKGCRGAGDFPCALVLAVPYHRQLTPDSYEEALFQADCTEAREAADALLGTLTALFKEHGVRHCLPGTGKRDEDISFKFAAVRAGLGWIGKNDTLVTEAYGPRLRLAVILLDAALPCGRPVLTSKCPPGCMLCTRACPCGAVQGVLWKPWTDREERLDYLLCDQSRSKEIPVLGRKNACGLCMTACPWGRVLH